MATMKPTKGARPVDVVTMSVGRSNTGTVDGNQPAGSVGQKTFSSLANVPRHKVSKLI